MTTLLTLFKPKYSTTTNTALKNLDRKIALGVFLLTLFASVLVSDGSVGSIDIFRRIYTTHAIWQNVPAVAPADIVGQRVIHGVNDSAHYWYGMGQSIFMLPGDIISAGVLNVMGINDDAVYTESANLKSVLLLLITFPVFSAGSTALAFLLLREFSFTLIHAVCGAFSLVFGTTLLFYTQLHQENSQILFLTIASYYWLILWVKRGSYFYLFLASGLLGVLILIRVTTLADIAGVMLFGLLVLLKNPPGSLPTAPHKQPNLGWLATKPIVAKLIALRGQLAKFLLTTGGWVLFFFIIDRVYNFKRFGNWSANYIQILVDQMRMGLILADDYNFMSPAQIPAGWPFNASRLETILKVLFSPGKSLFLYDSLLIVLIVVLLVRKFKVNNNSSTNLRSAFLLSAVVSLIFYLIGYSNLVFWSGDWAWGARYHTSAVQLLCLMAVPLFLEIRFKLKLLLRWFITSLIIVTFLIQLLSITMYFGLEIAMNSCETGRYWIDIIGNDFIIGQRLVNLTDMLANNQSRPCFAAASSNGMTVPYSIPFQLVGIDNTLRLILIALWGFLSIVLALALFKFIQKVRALSSQASN